MNTTTINPPTELVNKVNRQNLANKKTNEIINGLIPMFLCFVGKKIKKTSGYGGFVKSVEETLNAHSTNTETLSVNFNFSYSSFIVKIVHKAGHSYSQFITEELTIGRIDMETGILKDMILVKDLRKTDYSAEEIHSAMMEKEDLENRLREVSSRIPYFLR